METPTPASPLPLPPASLLSTQHHLDDITTSSPSGRRLQDRFGPVAPGYRSPPAPPALKFEDKGGQDLRPVVPAEEEIYELEGSGSSGHLPPPPSLPPPPASQAITSAHLFVPPTPTPPHKLSDLPQYVAGPSAPSLPERETPALPSTPEDFAVSGPSEPPSLPSAPLTETDSAAPASLAVVSSAPPMLEDGEVQQELGLARGTPPIEDNGYGRAGPSGPSRAA